MIEMLFKICRAEKHAYFNTNQKHPVGAGRHALLGGKASFAIKLY